MNSLADVVSGRAQWIVLNRSCLPVLKALPPRSVDHVITDPPYLPHIAENARTLRAFGNVLARDFGYASLTPELRENCAREFARICRRWCLTWSDIEGALPWRDDLVRFGLRHVRIGAWIRENTAPQFTGDRPAVGYEACEIAHVPGRMRWNGGGKPAVWCYPVVNRASAERSEKLHPTPKPLALMLDQVRDFTDPGDLVIDPFCGSGTTGVACVRLGRRFIGLELDPEHANNAALRIAAEADGALSLASWRARQTVLELGGAA